jgi:hypothetical protein
VARDAHWHAVITYPSRVLAVVKIVLIWFVVFSVLAVVLLGLGGVGVGEELLAVALSTAITWLLVRRRRSPV